MSDRLAIEIFPNGPIRVRGATSARFCGEPLEIGDEAWLCRCGGTKNPPFCDSTHRSQGFPDVPPPREPKEVKVWEGRNVRTRFNPNVCMHVFYCKPLKELRERELAGDDAAAQEIMRVVDACPSGALSWEAKTEVPAPERTAPCDIDIQEGGEVRIQGAFDINAERPGPAVADRATLCRCGMSRNKPWCDGRHAGRKGFR